MADYQANRGDTSLGDATEVINYVADAVGASDESREAALTALNASVPASDNDFPWLPLTIGLGAVGVGLAVLVVLTRARGRPSKP